MKQVGSFDTLVGSFRQRLESLPDKRTGKNTRYGMEDAALSAFSVFFTQTPSFLAFQRTIEKSKGRSNVQTLFGVDQIPSDNHIRDLLDPLKPELVSPVFEQALKMLDSGGQLNSFRTAENVLIAIDGTEYFSSSHIHCPQCSTRKLKSGEIRYFHSVVTPVIVSPNRTEVIPLVPEFVVPQDGHDKQDCENAAAKRWLLQHGQKYSPLKVTILGDDLYCHQPLCQLLLEQQFNFILTCLPTSHQTLYEHLEGLSLPTVIRTKWTGKVEEIYTYRYLNQVPLKDGDDALLFHTVLELLDEKYKLLRAHLPTRKTFFNDLRALTRYLVFDSWDHLLTFMIQGLELDLPLNTS